jgi:hypothetical protein
VKVPVITAAGEGAARQRVDVTLDVRAERYSDLPDPIVPAAGVRWLPWGNELAVRARASRSLSAPSLYQISGPSIAGSSTVQIAGADGRTGSGIAHVQSASGSALEPERAQSFFVGIAYAPVRGRGFSVELDYVRVRQRGVIGRLLPQLVLQDVETQGANSAYVAGHAGSRPGFDVRLENGFGSAGAKVTAPGQIAPRPDAVFLTNPHVNLGEREVEAVDGAMNFRS